MILDRYLATRYLANLATVITTFLAIFVLVDLFDNIDMFVDKGTPARTVARYYVYQIPYILLLLLPVAALIACFFGIGGLAAHGEIDAMRAAGISLTRILLPVLFMGALVSLAASGLAASAVPIGERTARNIEEIEIKGRPQINLRSRANLFYVGRTGYEYFMSRWDGRNHRMIGVEIKRVAEGEVREHITAERAEWDGEQWVLSNGTDRHFDGTVETLYRKFERLECPELVERPEDFSTEHRKTRELTLEELFERIEIKRRSGEEVAAELTDLHLRFSFPISTFVLVLVGAPLSARRKKGGAWLSFTLYVVAAFLFLAATRFLQTLGEHGTITPVAAAWSADGTFAILGLSLLILRQNGR